MPTIRERLFRLLGDPRVAELMRDPRAQAAVGKLFRFRGRLEGAYYGYVQRVAGTLNLATQKDLRALQRRIRDLERELRETEERLTEAQDAREARDRS